MLRADHAQVEWNSATKHWDVRILVGAEVIKRPIEHEPGDTPEATLKERAVAIARDEGYEVTPEQVEIASRVPA